MTKTGARALAKRGGTALAIGGCAFVVVALFLHLHRSWRWGGPIVFIEWLVAIAAGVVSGVVAWRRLGKDSTPAKEWDRFLEATPDDVD